LGIMAVRRVVKQVPVEILQQYFSPRSYVWMCIVMEQHYTRCQHSMPLFLKASMQFFSDSQYTSNTIMILYCIDSTISTPSLSQKTVEISFLADKVCLNFLGLLGECVCIQFFHCSSGFNLYNFIICHS
jgi:hypothetical protein